MAVTSPDTSGAFSESLSAKQKGQGKSPNKKKGVIEMRQYTYVVQAIVLFMSMFTFLVLTLRYVASLL